MTDLQHPTKAQIRAAEKRGRELARAYQRAPIQQRLAHDASILPTYRCSSCKKRRTARYFTYGRTVCEICRANPA